MSEALFYNREYQAWLKNVKDRYTRSQLKAAVRVNSTMLEFYWSLGADLVAKQEVDGWGSKIILQLSRDLRTSLVPKLDEGKIEHQPGARLSRLVDADSSIGNLVFPPACICSVASP